MNFKLQLALLFSVATLTVAQDVSSLPLCARAGALAAVGSSGCDTSDISCICNSRYFKSGLEQYAKENCSSQDYNTALTIGQALCARVGVAVVVTTTTLNPSNSTLTPTITTADQATSTTGTAAVVTTTEYCGCDDEDDDDDDSTATTAPTPIATYTGAASREVAIGSQLLAIAGGAVALVILA